MSSSYDRLAALLGYTDAEGNDIPPLPLPPLDEDAAVIFSRVIADDLIERLKTKPEPR